MYYNCGKFGEITLFYENARMLSHRCVQVRTLIKHMKVHTDWTMHFKVMFVNVLIHPSHGYSGKNKSMAREYGARM